MRIITWNVNALRTVLPYRPWNELQDKTIAGMLDAMNAEIICFQEHKARRDQMPKPMAVPPGFDAFFSFPYGKGGYSGTCVYTKLSYLVPLKAEEGITGLLLDGPSSCATGKSGGGLTREERIGGYPDEGDWDVVDEIIGGHFDLRKLDMEGRAVVLDFGLFIIFNLYCPNETNETRLPYKLNYLYALQSRITNLLSAGRNVIVVGDINVCHRPIDNGEGGIQRNAAEHFDHPARKWFDKWVWDGVRGTGILHDVTRERHPNRKGMFTCWNTKLDARPSNYGTRIDYILVSEGLLPWVKDSDIQADIMGSDHCPVYVDLHETITKEDGTTLHLKDLVNPTPRIPLPPALAQLEDPDRIAPPPPPFATLFWDEFSGKQRSLKDFFGKKGAPPPLPRKRSSSAKVSESPAPSIMSMAAEPAELTVLDSMDVESSSTSVDKPASEMPPSNATSAIIDLTEASEPRPSVESTASISKLTTNGKGTQKSKAGQRKLSSFFRQTSQEESPAKSTPTPSPVQKHETPDEHADYLFAKALAEQEEEGDDDETRAIDQAEVVSTWSNIFAKKVPPKCIVHGLPCKPFVTKIPGKNKGKKFWLCSKPVGEGWDKGRSKRPREEVNHQYRCDFFLWDSAVKEKEPLLSDKSSQAGPAIKKRKT